MSVLNDIVYLRQDQYDVLAADGTVGSLTGLQDDKIYFVTDSTITANDLDQNLVIPVSHGGTGKTSFTAGSVLIGNGSSPLTELSATNINTANTIVKRDANGDFNAGKATLTSATIASINITTKKLEPVNQINSDGGNMILGYKPSSGTGVTSSQWCVGTIDIQGVIRSSNTDLIHTRAGTNSIILDTGNWTSNIKYLPLYETRGTTTTLNKTANYVTSGAVFHLVASSSTSTTDNGKPPMGDANILQMNWDNNGGYDAQLAISTAANRMEFRDQPSTKKAWREVVTSTPGTAAGGTTQPVYIDTNGVATALSYTIAKSVPSDAKFSDTTYSDGTGLSLDGTTFNHSNSVTAQTTQAVYPIKIDAQGHISAYGSAIIPVTSVNGHTGSSVNVTIGDLGLSSALRFIGKATSTLSESTTTAPTISGITNYTPAVGDVVLDSDDEYEYVCIAKNGTTYTWEKLGSSSSYSLSTHVHGNITNDGKMSGSTASGTVTTSHKFLREDGTWQTPAYTTNTDEKVKVAALTSGTTYYPILATGTGTATRQVDTTLKGLSYISTAGTTSAVGTAILALGNNTAKGSINNEQGVLRLYGTTAYYVDMKMEDGLPAANRTMYLPSYAGTMYMVAATTTDAVGSTTKPIYINNVGAIQEGNELKDLAYIAKPSSNTTTTWLRGDGTWVAPPNDDTHYTTKLIAGGSSATAHAAVSSGNIYLRLFDDSTHRNDIQLAAGSNMTITSNANGVITFNSSYTNTDTLVNYTLDTTHRAYLMGSQNAPTSTATARAAHGDMGVYLSETAGQLSAKSLSLNDGAASASSNEMVWMQWNSTDQSLDFIFA